MVSWLSVVEFIDFYPFVACIFRFFVVDNGVLMGTTFLYSAAIRIIYLSLQDKISFTHDDIPFLYLRSATKALTAA